PGTNLNITIAGKPVASGNTGIASIERPVIARAWAKAKIASMLEELDRADGPKEKAKLKDQIVALSTQSRVLSPYTALLVLETENDYARFNIDRRALADVLTVDNGHVGVLKRGPESVAEAPK